MVASETKPESHHGDDEEQLDLPNDDGENEAQTADAAADECLSTSQSSDSFDCSVECYVPNCRVEAELRHTPLICGYPNSPSPRIHNWGTIRDNLEPSCVDPWDWLAQIEDDPLDAEIFQPEEETPPRDQTPSEPERDPREQKTNRQNEDSEYDSEECETLLGPRARKGRWSIASSRTLGRSEVDESVAEMEPTITVKKEIDEISQISESSHGDMEGGLVEAGKDEEKSIPDVLYQDDDPF
ncbi:hypothetical protein PT974_02237 [Cladobotryum mycophilum]|uniref:Uncharacterized protein n=1 Tax=Cladobotryum mycophilum TaxID=491253 RepID=A0ABR0SYP9_9HYPO